MAKIKWDGRGGQRRGSGRKKMSDDEKRLTRAHVKLTRDELDLLRMNAANCGLKPPAYLRALWELDKNGKVDWSD